jgi:hypothetical protein
MDIIADFAKNVKGNITFGAIFPKKIRNRDISYYEGKYYLWAIFPKKIRNRDISYKENSRISKQKKLKLDKADKCVIHAWAGRTSRL